MPTEVTSLYYIIIKLSLAFLLYSFSFLYDDNEITIKKDILLKYKYAKFYIKYNFLYIKIIWKYCTFIKLSDKILIKDLSWVL